MTHDARDDAATRRTAERGIRAAGPSRRDRGGSAAGRTLRAFPRSGAPLCAGGGRHGRTRAGCGDQATDHGARSAASGRAIAGAGAAHGPQPGFAGRRRPSPPFCRRRRSAGCRASVSFTCSTGSPGNASGKPMDCWSASAPGLQEEDAMNMAILPPAPGTVAAYLRVSSRVQRDRETIASQREAVLAPAGRRGWTDPGGTRVRRRRVQRRDARPAGAGGVARRGGGRRGGDGCGLCPPTVRAATSPTRCCCRRSSPARARGSSSFGSPTTRRRKACCCGKCCRPSPSTSARRSRNGRGAARSTAPVKVR